MTLRAPNAPVLAADYGAEEAAMARDRFTSSTLAGLRDDNVQDLGI